ncbi:galactose-specific lectin nattectin-like [Xiphophorus couchianus]|uniref:galactose-specific lectin nattectin-like n=1 Tax=Xiphophorus couchianus TaxID=32473 RepID=UPI001015EC80|nr:galactose-specific lectin nattectin-like [Xiphophorus couchianus]
MAAGLVFTLLLGLSFGLWDGADAVCQVRANTPLDCPAGWTWYNGRCFVFVKDIKRWIMAENTCLSMDGNLASMHSMDQYNFIRELIYNETGKHTSTWVGAHDSAQEGIWMWSDGSKFVFKVWGENEPNNIRGMEHCLQINHNERNHTSDEACAKKLPFICARPL